MHHRKNPFRDIPAIPTTFNGITYRSRMEARFAEFIHSRGLEYEYEKPFPGSKQGYIPDFFIPYFNLYIEVKPDALRHELYIFGDDIIEGSHPWMCVDKAGQEGWRITWANVTFLDGFSYMFPYYCLFDFIGIHSIWLLRIYPEYLDLSLGATEIYEECDHGN